jgi:hypothetical protein
VPDRLTVRDEAFPVEEMKESDLHGTEAVPQVMPLAFEIIVVVGLPQIAIAAQQDEELELTLVV